MTLEESELFLSNVDSLEKGMSVDQVKEILGNPDVDRILTTKESGEFITRELTYYLKNWEQNLVNLKKDLIISIYFDQQNILTKINFFSDAIRSIKLEVSEIDECENCQMEERDISAKTTEGNKAIFYSKDGVLKKTEIIHYGETGKIIEKLYYEDEAHEKVFFISVHNYKYNRPIYWNEEVSEKNNDNEVFDINKSEISEEEYYFLDENLILWVDKDKNKIINGENFKEKNVEMLKLADENIEIFQVQ